LWTVDSVFILDVDQLIEDIQPIAVPLRQAKRRPVEVEVEDDKAQALSDIGFIDVGLQPAQQTYMLPTDEQLTELHHFEREVSEEELEENFDDYFEEMKSSKSLKKIKSEE
jgi:alpha-galactosidase/6-phospho-beta-glucosidase family protein